MKITNTQQGARGVNTKEGPVLIEPGHTVDLDLSEAEAKIAKGTGWFEFGAAAAKAAEEDKK